MKHETVPERAPRQAYALRKRVLVTGGAGFLGSFLCERLLAAGHEVLCVDNFYTGTRNNILHLIDHPRFEVLRHDVTFPLYVEVDEIYNLACPASPVHYQNDPVQTVKTSVHGAINMLGLARRLRIKLLQASTSEVYGDPLEHPQTESYWGRVNPIGPRACYDEGKRCAETQVALRAPPRTGRSRLPCAAQRLSVALRASHPPPSLAARPRPPLRRAGMGRRVRMFADVVRHLCTGVGRQRIEMYRRGDSVGRWRGPVVERRLMVGSIRPRAAVGDFLDE